MIDLHTHSWCSDGTESPERVVEAAAAAGCSALALTDHDTLAGLDEAGAKADELGIELVPACEISCAGPYGPLHLLAYFVPRDGATAAALVARRAGRYERNARLLAHLVASGLPITKDEVDAVANGAIVGRPHFAEVLVRNGAAYSIPDAFDRYLSDEHLGVLAVAGTPVREVLSALLDDDAVGSLAHPNDLQRVGTLEATLEVLVAAGLVGLECDYATYDPPARAALRAVAARRGLVATGGSDAHGTRTPDVRVGTGTGDLAVGDDVLRVLRSRRPSRHKAADSTP